MRHRIGDLAHADQFAGDLEDLAVQRLVEMRRLQEIRDAVEGVVVDQDRAEQRLLGLDIVRRLAVERRFRHAEFAQLPLPWFPRLESLTFPVSDVVTEIVN